MWNKELKLLAGLLIAATLVLLSATCMGCARYVNRRVTPEVETVSKVTLWFQRAEAAAISTSEKDGPEGYERTVGVDGAVVDTTAQVAESLRAVADALEAVP